jgi:hypothetical protein
MFLSNVAEVYPEAGYIFFLVEEMPQYIAGISVFFGDSGVKYSESLDTEGVF